METIEERIAALEDSMLMINATLKNLMNRAEEDRSLMANKYVELCDWIKAIEHRLKVKE